MTLNRNESALPTAYFFREHSPRKLLRHKCPIAKVAWHWLADIPFRYGSNQSSAEGIRYKSPSLPQLRKQHSSNSVTSQSISKSSNPAQCDTKQAVTMSIIQHWSSCDPVPFPTQKNSRLCLVVASVYGMWRRLWRAFGGASRLGSEGSPTAPLIM